MSSLVSDFLINPVLRQARRFSRPSATLDEAEGQTNEQIPSHFPNGAAILEVAEVIGPDIGVRDTTSLGSLSGQAVVSSPIEEDGGLERELAARSRTNTLGAFETVSSAPAVPQRFASFPPARIGLDSGATSANPEFGIPARFETPSPHDSSLNSSIHDLRMSPLPRNMSPQHVAPQSTGASIIPRKRDSSLPEDDGMTELRRRIKAIHEMSLPSTEKARLRQELLTEEYSYRHPHLESKPSISDISSPTQSHERPVTPLSIRSFSLWPSSAGDTSIETSPDKPNLIFQLSVQDLQPTYVPIPPPDPVTLDGPSEIEEADQSPALGCRHYKRNVKMQCFDCNKWYTCRQCHDEVEDHILNRKATKNMLCMLCQCPQRAAEVCINCSARAAWYYCGICHLWDDDTTKSIYHCNDCGICRVGAGLGKDFFHCKTCDVCIKISNEFSHKCIERASQCDCPICGEYLFSSMKTVWFMKCGHSIHRTCYHDLMATTYKCPICSQSAVNMETQFRHLDRAIADQPMPAQFQDTKAFVSCNDCYAKTIVQYHWLGLKCGICDSYNTAQLRLLASDDIDAESVTEPAAAVMEEQIIQMDISRAIQPLSGSHATQSDPTNNTLNRRHSSHVQAVNIPTQVGPSYLSPYTVPDRIGRSVSPVRGNDLMDSTMADAADDNVSDDEEEVDFWGGIPSPTRDGQELEGDWSDDDAMSTDDDEEEEEDDPEDIDHMALIGHR